MRLEAAGIAIEGVSIAGHESFYKLPGFRTLLEFGRAPEDTLGYGTVCLSHGHLDHAAGLAHHASRRTLTGLRAGARLRAGGGDPGPRASGSPPASGSSTSRYGIAVRGRRVRARSVPLRRDLELRSSFPGRHRVPTVGYLFSEIRRKLKDEHAGRAGPGDRGAARPGSRGDAARGDPAPRLSGRLRRRRSSTRRRSSSGAGPPDRMLVSAPDDVERARVYEHLHSRRLPRARGPIRERGDRPDALLAALLGRERSARRSASCPPDSRRRVVPFLPPD